EIPHQWMAVDVQAVAASELDGDIHGRPAADEGAGFVEAQRAGRRLKIAPVERDRAGVEQARVRLLVAAGRLPPVGSEHDEIRAEQERSPRVLDAHLPPPARRGRGDGQPRLDVVLAVALDAFLDPRFGARIGRYGFVFRTDHDVYRSA